MKNKLSLITLTLAVCLVMNACQPPEQRVNTNSKPPSDSMAQDNTAVVPADTMSAMTSTVNPMPSTEGATAKPSTASALKTATVKKGKASVSMNSMDRNKDKMEMDKNGVYGRAEVMPSYPGGEAALEKFVEDNLQYPQDAIDNGIEGKVVVQFDVDEKGNLSHAVIVSEKLGDGLEDEALRIVKEMPKWNPGQMKGKNVKSKFTLPIIYQIY